ncbi:tape measure protein [Mesorhizobium sp. BR1-1-13]|uniref:tape measure protein n=1 Tax=Mesorhizobium sp. BR1-1-13 TaxID=2876656 RepID=UPI001CD0CB5C|nr:tape measure protein [Mesorhizobium sp. BR1-1-13]MBZ9943436.1 tape measure protein [Mesorhizobium sp. BR1-1-13]
MATDIERLVVQLSADVTKYQSALNKAMGITNTQTRNIENRFKDMNKNISSSFATALRGTTALVGGGLGIREITQYADAWTEAGNKIRAAASSNGVQTRSLSELVKGANDARTSLADYTDLYAKLIRSASGVAKSEQEIADVTNGVSKAFKAGGASAGEQAAGILQLGQALGSGVLQGDELRSLRENAPIIAKAIANEYKVSVAGLKALGAAGKLTSDRVFKAILEALPSIQKQFAVTNATIADGFLKVKNNLTEYIGTLAQTSGLTVALNTILGALAGNIESVANAAAAAGVVLAATFGRGALLATVGALANPFVLLAVAIGSAAYAVTELWDNVVPLEGSLASVGDYATALWDILKIGSNDAKEAVVGAFNAIVDGINGALAGVGTSIDGVIATVKSGVNAIVDTFVRMADAIKATFALVPAAVGDAVVTTMNAMIAGVEAGINKVIHAVNSAVDAINGLSGFAGIGPIKGIGDVDLGEIKNNYAGAGTAAGRAFDDAWSREAKDYVGDVGSAIAGGVTAATDAIVAKANEIHAARIALQKDADLSPDAGAKPSNAGFGGGVGNTPATGKHHAPKKTADDRFAEDIQSIKDRTAALKEEQATLGLSFYEQQKRKVSLDLEQEALKQVREEARKKGDADWQNAQLSPTQVKAIDQVSDAYARQADELRKAQEIQDLQRDALKGAFDDLRSALDDGKLDWQDFATIAENALDKIIDKIENDLVDAILQANSAGGGAGGIGSIFSSIFGGGSGSFPAAPGGTGGLYADGGYTGPGGKKKVAGLVHKGEVVFSQDDVSRNGGVAAVEALRRGGSIAAPSMPRIQAPANQNFAPSVTFAPVIQMQGGGNDTGQQVTEALKKFDKDFTPRVVKALREAKTRGMV